MKKKHLRIVSFTYIYIASDLIFRRKISWESEILGFHGGEYLNSSGF
jgi:hypothetical protein